MHVRPCTFTSTGCRNRRGFLVMDVLVGITICILLLMAFSVTVTRQAHAERQLAAIRSAARETESALFQVQAGAALPAGARVERLGDSAPAGFVWVRLTLPATADSPEDSIIGLVTHASAARVSAPAGGARP